MDSQMEQKYLAIKQAIDQGANVRDACAQYKMSKDIYYKHRKRLINAGQGSQVTHIRVKRKYTKRKTEMLSLPIPERSTFSPRQSFIIAAPIEELIKIMRQL